MSENKPREHPILFSAPMVRALLAGKKTQARQLMAGVTSEHRDPVQFFDPHEIVFGGPGQPAVVSVRFRVGDFFWVREDHARFSVGEGLDVAVPECVAYRASCDGDRFEYVNGRGESTRLRVTKWTRALTMPRWASRILLEITDVRVQRIQDIKERDVLAEGIDVPLAVTEPGTPWGDIPDLYTARRLMWDREHRNRRRREVSDESALWEVNPWVWALTFRRVENTAHMEHG